MNLLKLCGLQIRLCLFTFWPIASKQLNSLTTIVTLSWPGVAGVTHPLLVREFTGSIPGKSFYLWFFVLLLLSGFTFLSKNRLFVKIVCNFFCIVTLFSILNILQDCWPIIRVLRYRPSILNNTQVNHLTSPFCHGALKLDLSTLFTTFFLRTSLPFIFRLIISTWHVINVTNCDQYIQV